MPDLAPHQEENVQFFHKAGHRILCADPTGLGKTRSAVASVKDSPTVLVIGPDICFQSWQTECQNWGISILPFKQKDLHYGWEFLNIENVRYDPNVGAFTTNLGRHLYELLQKRHYDAVIVDEAHSVKNRKAKQHMGVKKVGMHVRAMIELTATPIVNKVPDIWGMLHTMRPKEFSSFWNFVKKHADARPGIFGWQFNDEATNPYALWEDIKHCVIRHEKSILNLPPKIVVDLYVKPTRKQAILLQEIADWGISETPEIIVPHLLARLTRLRQISICPSLVGGPADGAKVRALKEMLIGSNERTVVFTTFAAAASMISDVISPYRKNVYVSKDVPKHKRPDVIRKFSEGQVDLLIGTVGTMGTSIDTLAATCSNGIFVDRHYSPVLNEQAEDRLWRWGQKNSVTITNLYLENGIDKHVYDILGHKQSLIEAFLESIRKTL